MRRKLLIILWVIMIGMVKKEKMFLFCMAHRTSSPKLQIR